MKRISMRSLLVGIDPGSLYTRVVVADAQQEISEPSLAAVTTQGEVVAVGTEAAIRLRAEPRGLVAVRPFAGGVVAQQAAAQLLLQSILDKVQRGAVTRPTVCLAVPSLAGGSPGMAADDAQSGRIGNAAGGSRRGDGDRYRLGSVTGGSGRCGGLRRRIYADRAFRRRLSR